MEKGLLPHILGLPMVIDILVLLLEAHQLGLGIVKIQLSIGHSRKVVEYPVTCLP